MSLAQTSIKRPTFITCIVLVTLAIGLMAMKRLGVDLFPNVTFPIVMVSTPYRGAGPAEVETLISKPLEDEVSTLSGIKRVSSINQEGVSTVVAEFTLETDIKFAEQQIRDRVSAAKRKFPKDADESVIRRMDPSDQPVLIASLEADLTPAQLYDLATETIKPQLEQVAQVGVVEVLGGRKREIRVDLNRDLLKSHELSVTQVASRLSAAGENIPAGKVNEGKREIVFRSLGQFNSLKDVEGTLVNFYGSDKPVTVGQIGKVKDDLKDELSRVYVNGKKSLFIYMFKQTGSNTIKVVADLKKKLEKINEESNTIPGKPKLTVVRDGAVWIQNNVDDVKESIMIGVLLAVIVVYFFLGNARSTIITGLALPNSMIGAFILMALFGFTINLMTLLALSLTVGLLVDDAIVVRENIFRHLEMGKHPVRAALEGTQEVGLAVIATTLTVIAVFGPIAFLKGVVGQFFKEFGLTVCFAMAISLFDALTIAPMLSAYFAGKAHQERGNGIWDRTFGRLVVGFDHFQTWLENQYERLVRFTVRRPYVVLGASFLIFVVCMSSTKFVTKTFLPPQDAGEFAIGLDLPPGTSLEEMDHLSQEVDQVLRKNPEVLVSAITVGGRNQESNVAEFYVRLVPFKKRGISTIEFKDRLREQLKVFARANPVVKDYDAVGGGQRPLNINIIGQDQKQIEQIAQDAFQVIRKHPALKDVDINFRPGKPEFQVQFDDRLADEFGVSTNFLGQELRSQIEGVTPAKFRQNGLEYDIRVRLQEDQRNLRENFKKMWVPNINNQLVRLSNVTRPVEAEGPAKIFRSERGKYIQINADIAATGGGMGQALQDITHYFTVEKPLPPGVRFIFVGQAENFKEMGESMVMAIFFGTLFIFLILASLYESFVTPMTIMLALPLAMAGSFVALFLAKSSLNIFSMIGVVMLLGVATKNSILLVDYANQLVLAGADRADAIVRAGKTRLRPILMTTMALIAGTIPIALGLNEASRQRTSMGIAIIGGLISSTLLTLVVVPATYSYIDRFRIWSKATIGRWVGVSSTESNGKNAHPEHSNLDFNRPVS